MLKKDFIPIRRKFLKINLLVFSVILVVLSVLVLGLTYYILRDNLLQQLYLSSKIVGNRAAPAILWDNKEEAQGVLIDLSGKDSIVSACIYDNKKNLFASYSKDGGFCNNIIDDEVIRYSFSHVVVKYKINYNEEYVGDIFIQSNSSDVYDAMPKYIYMSLSVMVCAIILLYLITIKFHKNISSPIEELTKVLDQVTKAKNYDVKSTVKSNDEIGNLSKSLNKMIAEINKRDRKLKDLNKSLENSNKNLEKKVYERTKDLEDELNRRNVFAAHFSHEAKTPASNINGLVKAMLEVWDEISDAERIQMLGLLDESADRLCVLVGELTDMSLLDSGATKLNMKENNLYDLCKKVVSECESLKGKDASKVRIKIKLLKPRCNTNLICDSSKVMQLLTNLVNNAVRYSNEGIIKIKIDKTTYRGEAFKVSISDQGVGIPKGELRAIFNLGIQSSKTYDQSGGKGIGLALSEKIVKCHKGKIWAENNKNGVGSTFSFIIKASHNAGSYSV